MKVTLTFKTPDVTSQCPSDTSNEMYMFINEYLRYGEIISVTFDLDTKTATVQNLNS
jgi:hypothetical protein